MQRSDKLKLLEIIVEVGVVIDRLVPILDYKYDAQFDIANKLETIKADLEGLINE